MVRMDREQRRKIALSLGWSPEKVAGFILGHGEPLGKPHSPVVGPRLAYIPVPSIESRGSGRAEVVAGVRRSSSPYLAERPVRTFNDSRSFFPG